MKSVKIDNMCDHVWVYGGALCKCSQCGAYLQPSGDITTSPTGRGGKVLEHLTESPEVWTDADAGEFMQLPNFLPIWRRATSRELRQFVEAFKFESAMESPPGTGALKQLTGIASQLINGAVQPTQATYDKLSRAINDTGLLRRWCRGYTSIKLKLPLAKRSNPDIEAEFVLPADSFKSDFVERFIAGRETLNGLLHRRPIIELRLAPAVINRCSTADQIISTLQSAVEYYDHGLEAASKEMNVSIARMGAVTRQMIITTPLVGIVTFPLICLLNLEHIQVGPKAFEIDRKMIAAVRGFMDVIHKLPKATAEDQRDVVKAMKQSISKATGSKLHTEIAGTINDLPDTLLAMCEGKLVDQIGAISRNIISAMVESTVMTEAAKGKVKRLKKIPMDLVSYVVIEGEAIRDANDKMLIVSYAYGKLEIIEWYIELIDVQSKRYIVPHTRDYLVTVKRDMMAAIKKIMDTPIAKPSDPVVSINYPTGYDG